MYDSASLTSRCDFISDIEPEGLRRARLGTVGAHAAKRGRACACVCVRLCGAAPQPCQGLCE